MARSESFQLYPTEDQKARLAISIKYWHLLRSWVINHPPQPPGHYPLSRVIKLYRDKREEFLEKAKGEPFTFSGEDRYQPTIYRAWLDNAIASGFLKAVDSEWSREIPPNKLEANVGPKWSDSLDYIRLPGVGWVSVIPGPETYLDDWSWFEIEAGSKGVGTITFHWSEKNEEQLDDQIGQE